MAKIDVQLEQYEEIKLYGLWMKSNDKTISKDIPRLTSTYHLETNAQENTVLPLFVLSQNYDESTCDFELFIGGLTASGALACLELPKGQYAKVTVRPKLGFAWGLAVGEAKRYFYTKWLPSSIYQAVNMEYEYHAEKSMGKAPTIDVVFAIKERIN